MQDLRDITIKDKAIKENAQAVIQAIENCLNINKESVMFNRNVGTNIERFLFEPFTFSVKHKLESDIKRNIESQVSLAKVLSIDIDMNEIKRSYNVHINVTINDVQHTIEKELKSKE